MERLTTGNILLFITASVHITSSGKALLPAAASDNSIGRLFSRLEDDVLSLPTMLLVDLCCLTFRFPALQHLFDVSGAVAEAPPKHDSHERFKESHWPLKGAPH
jgi:hypothetical protein